MGLLDKIADALGNDASSEQTKSIAPDKNKGVFEIPEWAVKDRVNVEKRTSIICEYYAVNENQARVIAQEMKDAMESTEGYSQDSIISGLEEDLNINYDLIETIVWTERASIETIDRVNSYLDKNDSDQLYKISAPEDDRTHPVTREAANEIEEKNGVTLEELARILINKAEKYEDAGGTPERMEHWVPHERFRFSIVAYVDV
jgi:hypothetical protein